MSNLKIVPSLEKKILEGFGLNHAEYQIYQKSGQILDKTGLKIPLQLGISELERFKYVPGINAVNQIEYNTANHDDRFYLNYAFEKRNSKLSWSNLNNYGGLVFSDLSFEDITDSITGLKITQNFPIDTALFTVTQTKNIIKTAISGADGSIKEYISDGDYIINIKGIITGENGVYPFYEVQNLLEFLKLKQNLYISSNYLNDLFGVVSVVIDNFEFPQDEGGISFQKFNINCLSDNPVVLNLTSNSKINF